MVQVLVRTLDGDSLEVGPLGPESTVFNLKELIADDWGIPPAFQRVVFETELLEDSALLAVHGEAEDFSVTWFVSLDKVSELEQVAAWESLAHRGRNCSKVTIRALSTCARDDRSRRLRTLAMEALAEVAEKGDESVIDLAMRSLEDGLSTGVRKAAVKALARVARKDDSNIVTSLVALFHHEDNMVRAAAVDTLAQVATDCSKHAVDATLALLQDESWNVRSAAITCLAIVAKTNDSVIAGLTACLGDSDEDVQKAAAVALDLPLDWIYK